MTFRVVLMMVALMPETVNGCAVTSTRDDIHATIGDDIELQWDVEIPHDMIFGGIDCSHDGKLIAYRTERNIFKPSRRADERVSTRRQAQKYTVKIKDLRLDDNGSYECTILCISTRGKFYSKQVELNVLESDEKNNKGKNNTTTNHIDESDGDGSWTSKNQLIVIAMVTVSFILLILIIIALVLCIKKEFYKFVFTKQAPKKDREEPHPAQFEEQHYADLSTFQSTQYSELDISSSLWKSHDYEYVSSSVLGKKVEKRKSSVSSPHYEYVDPSTPLRKASIDFE